LHKAGFHEPGLFYVARTIPRGLIDSQRLAPRIQAGLRPAIPSGCATNLSRPAAGYMIIS
jgi:hypothetical protein